MSYRLKVKNNKNKNLQEADVGNLMLVGGLAGTVLGATIILLATRLGIKSKARQMAAAEKIRAVVQKNSPDIDIKNLSAAKVGEIVAQESEQIANLVREEGVQVSQQEVKEKVKEAAKAAQSAQQSAPAENPNTPKTNIQFLKPYQEQSPQARTEIMKYVISNFSTLDAKQKQKYMDDQTVYAKQFINKFNELGSKLKKPEDLNLIGKELSKAAEEQPATQAAEKSKQSPKKGEQAKQAAAPAAQASEKTSKKVPARFGATVEFLENSLPNLNIKWKNNKEAVILIMKALNDAANAGLISDIPKVTEKPVKTAAITETQKRQNKNNPKPTRRVPPRATGLQFILNNLFKEKVFKDLFRLKPEVREAIEKLFTGLVSKKAETSSTTSQQQPVNPTATPPPEAIQQQAAEPAAPPVAANHEKQTNPAIPLAAQVKEPETSSEQNLAAQDSQDIDKELRKKYFDIYWTGLLARIEEFVKKYSVGENTKKSLIDAAKKLLDKKIDDIDIKPEDYSWLLVLNPDGSTYNYELAYFIKDRIPEIESLSQYKKQILKKYSVDEGLFQKFAINKKINNSKQLFTFDGNKFKKYNRG
jgi:hypothetical protein